MIRDSLAARLSLAPEANETGSWQRHATARMARQALAGRAGAGRWGTRGAFPVLYLGRPTDSVVVEAYRHLVDPVDVEDPGGREQLLDNLLPRVLISCRVSVSGLLDLRSAAARGHAGLTLQTLGSSPSGNYASCGTRTDPAKPRTPGPAGLAPGSRTTPHLSVLAVMMLTHSPMEDA